MGRYKFKELIDRPLGDKIAETKAVIRRHLSRSVVFWSGGKDSTVLLQMALDMDKNVPVCFIDSGVELPETLSYVRYLARRWKLRDFTILTPAASAWSVPESPSPEYLNCVYWFRVEPSLRFLSKRGKTVELLGDRGGEHHEDPEPISKDFTAPWISLPAAYPLWYWSRDDVVGFLTEKGVLENPIYAKGWTETTGCSYCPFRNRLEVLKQTHPALFTGLLSKSGTTGLSELREKLRAMLAGKEGRRA